MIKIDGHDDAFVGVVRDGEGGLIAVYSENKIIDTLVTRDGMGRDDAREYFLFNIEGSCGADGYPIFIVTGSMDEFAGGPA